MTTESQNASTNVSKVQLRTSKRILSVTLKRLVDTDPDTSYYGEYASRSTSNYSIDRNHALDCASQTYNVRVDDIRTVKHAISYLEQSIEGRDPYYSDYIDACSDAIEMLSEALDEMGECDCGERGDRERNEYCYFNPSFNYVDEHDKPRDNLTPDEIRKYVRQDYERMESLNVGHWSYIGIRAEAEVQLTGDLCQTITSGGLWGIESDSDHTYFAEVENEQLAELREQLESMGFSKRAVSAAFRDIERTNE